VNRNSPVVLRAPMEAQGHLCPRVCPWTKLGVRDRCRSGRTAPAQTTTDTDPYSGRPFSTPGLCGELPDKGSGRRFGPGTSARRSLGRCATERYLIGQGVAAAIFTPLGDGQERRESPLNRRTGAALVEAAAHDHRHRHLHGDDAGPPAERASAWNLTE